MTRESINNVLANPARSKRVLGAMAKRMKHLVRAFHLANVAAEPFGPSLEASRFIGGYFGEEPRAGPLFLAN